MAVQGRSEPPELPRGLLKATAGAWTAFWSSPLAALVTPADHPAVARLFSLYDERDRALRGYRRQRLVLGSTGQPVLNPLFAAVKALDADILAIEDRFGLSPIARLRLGVALGEAARSLEELTRDLDLEDDDADDGVDPRLRVVDAAAGAAAADAGRARLPVD